MVVSKSIKERLKDAVIMLILAGAALICLLPIIYTLAVALSDKAKAEA